MDENQSKQPPVISASECVEHCSVFHSYTGLMTDAPHWLFELTVEAATAPFAYAVGKAVARREHRKIDTEHGVVHADSHDRRTRRRRAPSS